MKNYLDRPQKNFFTENPEKTAKELAAIITPLIICNLKTQIDKQQNDLVSNVQSFMKA
jgi:hypothetical protein